MTHDAFAGLLKRWRAARRLSQEQLALEAGVSTRHLSFLETGNRCATHYRACASFCHLDTANI